MKLVVSRKGFDSAAGGVASPVFPDGSLYSIPIQAAGAQAAYADIARGSIAAGTDLGTVVEDLTRDRLPRSSLAHLDPDLDAGDRPRRPGWRPAFGQTGAAATHLRRCGVGVGDVFLFFGWFRPATRGPGGRWRYSPDAPHWHMAFGWLQVGAVLPVDAIGRAAILAERPWLCDHPHLHFGPDPRNVLYLAADRLVLPGLGDIGLPGAGSLKNLAARRILTCPSSPKRSLWRLPAWFGPGREGAPLTYHGDPGRWRGDGGDVLLDVVAQGQEFVLDCAGRPAAAAWLADLIR